MSAHTHLPFLNANGRLHTASPLFPAAPLAPRIFHLERLPDFRPTPLVPIQYAGVQCHVKDESLRCGLPAFKILGASFATFIILCEQWGLDSSSATMANLQSCAADGHNTRTALYTATDGNHGRAIARFAAQIGITAVVFVPRDTTHSTRAAIESEGATVHVVQGDYDTAVKRATEASTRGQGRLLVQDTAWQGYERIPNLIVQGYKTIFEEMDEQLLHTGQQTVTHVVVPVGVGSLAYSCLLHYRRSVLPIAKRPRIITVEPQEAACLLTSLKKGKATSIQTGTTCMAGLNCGTVSSQAWPDLRRGVDAAVCVSEEDVVTAMKQLSENGVYAGPCGAASLAALCSITRDERLTHALGLDDASTVVLISSEGPAAVRGLISSPGSLAE